MIHILTQSPEIQKQLGHLLQELGHEYAVHEALEPLLKSVRKLSKNDHVFYDLRLEDVLWAFERLYTVCKKTNLVTFERLTQETSLENNQCPAGVENYLLLPSNHDRAIKRVQALLREIAQKTSARSAARKKTKAQKTKARKHPQTANASSLTPDTETDDDTPPNAPVYLTIARYLQARSPAMQAFLPEIQAASESDAIIFVEGEEGSEFELVAREINFRSNGDAHPLHVLDPVQLDSEEFTSLLNSSAQSELTEYVYLGQTFDWTPKTAEAVQNLLEQLDAAQGASLRLIIGHADDSESYFPDAVRTFVKILRKRSRTLTLPNMAERSEDIPVIAHTVFSTLRMAHPFLRTRALSNEAVRYLQSECETMDYARVARIIRNAMALSQQNTITESAVRNLSDNSPMTQHLIESLADEQYFRTAD